MPLLLLLLTGCAVGREGASEHSTEHKTASFCGCMQSEHACHRPPGRWEPRRPQFHLQGTLEVGRTKCRTNDTSSARAASGTPSPHGEQGAGQHPVTAPSEGLVVCRALNSQLGRKRKPTETRRHTGGCCTDRQRQQLQAVFEGVRSTQDPQRV